MVRSWISRQAEAEWPEFGSFQEAWEYLKGVFGEDLVLETVDVVGGEKCYFSALVTDWVAYDEMNRLFEKGEPVVGMRYMACRQPIQIFEDGQVHVVH